MAIYHLRLTPVKKAGTTIARTAHHGGFRLTSGATGKAAYQAGERLSCPDGLLVDYRSKTDGVEYSQLILPGGGTTDREQLWNAIDSHPTQRETADIAYDMVVAYPHELTFAERKAAAVALARWITERYGVAVDLGMHKPEINKGSDQRNYHGHYLISHRRVSPTGEIGLVNRDFNHLACTRVDEKRGRNERRKTAAVEIRSAWQTIANEALAGGGHKERIDFRSYKERGINREPTKHRGPVETKLMREHETSLAPTNQALGNEATRTVAAIRAKLAAALRKCTRENKRIALQIAKQQAARVVAKQSFVITSKIGHVESWLYDPVREFIRAWQAADAVDKLRIELSNIQQARPAMRPATRAEAARQRRDRRELSRLEKFQARLESALESTRGLDPQTQIKSTDEPLTPQKLSAIERELGLQKTATPLHQTIAVEQEVRSL